VVERWSGGGIKMIESERIKDRANKTMPEVPIWEKWGPYVSERGWGTVREDYSADGNAWWHFTHDDARKRAFRRCEDGIAGISDRYQVLLFAPVFWNGKDPILKERLFGLNAWEGNHGEDVKEYSYFLDATPTASYLKYLYKYPQEQYPYDQLVSENQTRSPLQPEFELVDTGIFDKNRYFDIFIEYAKADSEDICIRIEAVNRGDQPAPLHLLPQLWFRKQWGWDGQKEPEPEIQGTKGAKTIGLIADDTNMQSPKYILFDYHLGKRHLYGPTGGRFLFTNNESNKQALWKVPNETPFVKDAFHRYLIGKELGAINPMLTGTKAALYYYYSAIQPGKSIVLHLRLTPNNMDDPLHDVEAIIEKRRKEADDYYNQIHPKNLTEEEKLIQRRALAGMVWNKQIYIFEVSHWLKGDDPVNPPPESHKYIRNMHWGHLLSYRILSMPDKWEYPWFASWDLTFHSLTFTLIDIEFAKHQLWLLLFDQFQHPNGAIPAYEWDFSNITPPVQAWALLKLFYWEKEKLGREDTVFLEKCFHKLLLNFSWWINRVDVEGNNVFEGGFLGMDNIGIPDHSQIPEDIKVDQVDGTGWISLFCLNLMRISLTLAKKNPVYEGLGIKFFQHFLYVSAAMRKGGFRLYDMWNDEDGFFYTYFRYSDGRTEEVRMRSLVGLIPFFAFDAWDEEELKQFPAFYSSYQWILEKRTDLASKCIHKIPNGNSCYHLMGPLNTHEIEKLLKVVWDPQEFRSDYGLRSISKYHEKNPVSAQGVTVGYEPGESHEKIKGGNSNWRGPIWFPINYFLIETLRNLGKVYKDSLKIKVGKEADVTLDQMAASFGERLLNLFKRNDRGERPFLGDVEKFQKDPYFKDHILFHEHFHGDNGRGLGACHQTGWTGLIANIIGEFRR
jgi:hypothetical protein